DEQQPAGDHRSERDAARDAHREVRGPSPLPPPRGEAEVDAEDDEAQPADARGERAGAQDERDRVQRDSDDLAHPRVTRAHGSCTVGDGSSRQSRNGTAEPSRIPAVAAPPSAVSRNRPATPLHQTIPRPRTEASATRTRWRRSPTSLQTGATRSVGPRWLRHVSPSKNISQPRGSWARMTRARSDRRSFSAPTSNVASGTTVHGAR